MKYKFVGEDEHMFRVQHPDGSEFSIAKSAVGPGVHKRIKQLESVKMAEGGEVTDFSDTAASRMPDEKVSDIPETPSKADRSPAGLSDAMKSADSWLSSHGVYGSKDKGSDVPSASTDQPAGPTAPAAPNAAPVMPPQEQTPASQIPGMADTSNAYANSFAQKEAGIKGIAGAQEKAGKEQAEAYQNQVDQIAKSTAHYEEAHAQLEKEHQDLMDAVMKDKIDPQRLMGNMSTGNKIIAAISVALSGIGSGLTGQPNMAMSVIQKNIDRDIDAQKMEVGKKHTLLSENLKRFGDLHTATQMTQLQMNAMTSAKIAQIAAKSGSAQAQAQAKMLLGDLGLQAAQIKQQISMRNAAAQGGNDPSALVQFIVPEHHQKAVFDEIERAQDTRRMGSSILKAFDQATQENTILKTGAGLLRTPPGVFALHQAMQPTFKDLEGTVRQAAMDNTFKNITPRPGDMDSTIKTKRAALEDYLKSKASAPTAKGFGIDLDKFGSTTTQQQKYKTVGGVKYMRGPNGEAVPVK